MTLATRPGRRAVPAAPPARRTRVDVLFAVAVGLLIAVHVVIFGATLLLAPVTVAEQRSLDLLQLPVEVGRVLTLPFDALLLGSVFVLGRRSAGRWGGFGSMLAVLALDLRTDAADPIYGPAVATGGIVAAALLAAALVLLPRRRLVAAVLVGAASGFAGLAALALPGFLAAVALFPASRPGRGARARELGAFAAAWAVPAALLQLVWFSRLGAEGWSARLGEYLAEFQPHALVPWFTQQVMVFGVWHFPAAVTASLASTLFIAGGIGISRYLRTPRPEEGPPRALAVVRRIPVELWAAAFTVVGFATWWSLSGSTTIVDPNLPVLVAVAPLLTGLAYRGAKHLLTVNRFWALAAVVYLTGLMTARAIQLVMTLIDTFSH